MTTHPADRPYRLIVTDDPCKTLAQGEARCYPSMLAAANAFVKATEPFKTVVYDDGCCARELNRDEQRLLENVCAEAGLRRGGGGRLVPYRLCLEPRCPRKATARGRCDEHRKPTERERSRARREATKGVLGRRLESCLGASNRGET